MLKGLKGILEKGLQIAAPFIGNMIMPGVGGSMLGSGIASLLTGNKPKDALLSMGGAYLSGIGNPQGSPLKALLPGQQAGPASTTVQKGNFFNKTPLIPTKKQGDSGNIYGDLFSKFMAPRGSEENPKPSYGMQALATGLPAYLSYLAAKEDADKANVPDMADYMSATDKFYGGQFERPPEERRIQNLAQGGMLGREQPIEYSAATGQGIMGFAKGGEIDVKELELLMDDGKMTYEEALDYLKSIQGKAKGGEVYPRKTGAISGPGTKTSDDIPAMLSDGEFVQRTDAVNGAGVMMGARNAEDARKKGADFMYALQDKLSKVGQRVA